MKLAIAVSMINQGKLIEMEMVRNISAKLRFSPAEIEKYELKDLPGGRVGWNPIRCENKNILFETSEIDVIKKGIDLLLTERDKKGEVEIFDLNLRDRFADFKTKK